MARKLVTTKQQEPSTIGPGPYQVELLDNFGRWQHMSLRDGWACFADVGSARHCVALQVAGGFPLASLRIVDSAGKGFL